MCIIPWSPLNRSFFEVITLWTGGMLWSFAPLAFPFPLLLLRAGDRGCREYYRKMMALEGPEHTIPRTPGASRLHAPQNNIAHALPSDTPRGSDGGRRQRRRHTRGPQGPGYEAAIMACVRTLEAKRTDYLSHRQPVLRRLTRDIAEYGCPAEEYGIRANRMPKPKR